MIIDLFFAAVHFNIGIKMPHFEMIELIIIQKTHSPPHFFFTINKLQIFVKREIVQHSSDNFMNLSQRIIAGNRMIAHIRKIPVAKIRIQTKINHNWIFVNNTFLLASCQMAEFRNQTIENSHINCMVIGVKPSGLFRRQILPEFFLCNIHIVGKAIRAGISQTVKIITV